MSLNSKIFKSSTGSVITRSLFTPPNRLEASKRGHLSRLPNNAQRVVLIIPSSWMFETGQQTGSDQFQATSLFKAGSMASIPPFTTKELRKEVGEVFFQERTLALIIAIIMSAKYHKICLNNFQSFVNYPVCLFVSWAYCPSVCVHKNVSNKTDPPILNSERPLGHPKIPREFTIQTILLANFNQIISVP